MTIILVKKAYAMAKSSSAVKMYHVFGYNHDIPKERWSMSVPETEINYNLGGLCREYYEILQPYGEYIGKDKKWVVPKRLALLEASTAEADTQKLIKLVKKLVIDLREYCKKTGGGDNGVMLVSGIVKGGEIVW